MIDFARRTLQALHCFGRPPGPQQNDSHSALVGDTSESSCPPDEHPRVPPWAARELTTSLAHQRLAIITVYSLAILLANGYVPGLGL